MMEERVNFLSDKFKLEGILSYNEDDGLDKDDNGLCCSARHILG